MKMEIFQSTKHCVTPGANKTRYGYNIIIVYPPEDEEHLGLLAAKAGCVVKPVL